MKAKRADLKTLADLADLVFLSRSQKLAQSLAAERAAARAFHQLSEARAAAVHEADPSDTAAMVALTRWQTWALQELKIRAARQATDRASLLRDKRSAAEALARREAARSLQARAEAEASRDKEKARLQSLLDLDIIRQARRGETFLP